jgi:sigma-B regulation protein RsbU (phosphoserine phosphatase)
VLEFRHIDSMLNPSPAREPVLEIVGPDRSRQIISVAPLPFLIGRGGDAGNHLQLADGRISRNCAAIVAEDGGYQLEDRGHRYGIFVNGEKSGRRSLHDGDVITFGVANGYEIVFRGSSGNPSIASMLDRIGNMSSSTDMFPLGGLSKLNLLLEATSLLHSQLPLDAVLTAMLDHTIAIAHADRGLLLAPGASGAWKVRLARSEGGATLAAEGLSPSQTALRQATERQASVITEDLSTSGAELQGAESIVVQRLRSIVVIPLYALRRANSSETVIFQRDELLGMLYLDSRRPAAFSAMDRQIIDALGAEAASILDNARLVERERERQRLEQELSIGREIQQALLPRGLCDFPYLAVTGVQLPCHAVGGDYFDVFPIDDDHTAVLIADVSGKGLGAALLATMLQGALSGMTMGADPARLFTHLNRFLCEHAEVGRYATMFFGVIRSDGTLEFIKAGHPSPLLLRDGKVSDLYEGGSFPVGLLPEATFVSSTIKLQSEDTLVLFSDGITEAEDAEENLFGVPRLREVLMGQQGAPLDQLKRATLDSVERFAGGASQSDDRTLLIVRYRAPLGSDSGAK